jgi:superfamily II DNA or RNA helicase
VYTNIMATAKIELKDEVNCKIHGLDTATRRKLNNKFSFILPHAYHVPAFKLGRWDGKVNFFTFGAQTFVPLLEDILPILVAEGYEIELDDQRVKYKFELPTIEVDHFSGKSWPEGHPAVGQPVMLRDYQQQVINRFMENPMAIQEIATGAGKCQPYNSQVLTGNGWKNMGDLNVGESVRTPDGKLAKILSVYEPGSKDIYELELKDGRTVRCCGDHIWPVYNIDWRSNTKKGGPIRNLTTLELIEHMKRSKRPIGLPLASFEHDCNDINLPMDPWLLGFLLGDGSFRHNSVTFSSADQELVEKVASKLDDDYVVEHKSGYDYSIKFKNKSLQHQAHSNLMSLYKRNASGHIIENGKSGNCYRQQIIEMGLDNKLSDEKFIPEIYFSGSLEQRLELIRGLVDSNGTIDKGSVYFSSTSKDLATGFARLIHSVGGIAKVKPRTNNTYLYKGEKRQCKDSYTVPTKFPEPWKLVSLLRKKSLTKNSYQYGPTLKNNIVEIRKVGHEPVRCIYIDHPDHLYLTDNYVVTHNTLITAALSNLVELAFQDTSTPSGRTIVIVPNKGLVTQTEEDYINLGLDVGVYFGDRKDIGKTHTICTWQSLEVMQKRFKNGDSELSLADFADGVVAVIVDECHQSKAEVLKKLLAGPFANVPLRWGLTGTIPKEPESAMSLKSCLGPVVGDLAASTLQDEGILSNCHIDVLQLLDGVSYDNYQSELAYLTTDTKRLDYLAEVLSKIADNGNTLVLIDRVKSGEGLVERLGERAVLVSGKMKNDDRRDQYKEVSSSNDKIIVATYGVAAVGINVPRIFNLVLLEPGKSFVRVIQSIGRGLRKAEDKDFVNVYDICSAAKFSKRHLTTRKKFYKDARYDYKITKVDWQAEQSVGAKLKERLNAAKKR